MQPILPVKKIKVATRQCYGDGDGVVRCEQALNGWFTLRLQQHIFYLEMGK